MEEKDFRDLVKFLISRGYLKGNNKQVARALRELAEQYEA